MPFLFHYNSFSIYKKLIDLNPKIIEELDEYHGFFKKYDKKSIIFNILFILGISFIVACAWEIFEFASDKIFGKDAQNVLTTGVDDTMKDMIVAVLGTILYCILYSYEEKENKKIIIKKFIKNI